MTITLEVEHVTTVKLRLKIGDGWVSMLQSFSERAAIHAVARPTIRASPVLGAVASRARLAIRQGGEGAANRGGSISAQHGRTVLCAGLRSERKCRGTCPGISVGYFRPFGYRTKMWVSMLISGAFAKNILAKQ